MGRKTINEGRRLTPAEAMRRFREKKRREGLTRREEWIPEAVPEAVIARAEEVEALRKALAEARDERDQARDRATIAMREREKALVELVNLNYRSRPLVDDPEKDALRKNLDAARGARDKAMVRADWYRYFFFVASFLAAIFLFIAIWQVI